MRLTTFTDYSLRVLMFLATEPGRRATIREIAQAFGISENHLMKVVHLLGRSGWLANVRGRGGGLQLAIPPSEINLGDVVRGTESTMMPAECFDSESNTCTIAPICELRGVLGEAARAFYAVLDRHTLEDVVRNRRALARVLFVPRMPAGESKPAVGSEPATDLASAPASTARAATRRTATRRTATAPAPAAVKGP